MTRLLGFAAGGLHNGDMSVAIGDLVNLARRQGEAWLASTRR
jgi:hypothetical protein